MHIDSKHKRILYAVIAIIAVAAIWLYSYFIDTTEQVLAPKCVFFQLTGFKCPGCGTQRALHELFHGNLLGPWKFNPILYFIIPYLIFLFYMQTFGGRERYPEVYSAVMSRPAIMTVFVVIVAYWLFRNVFGF